MQVKIKKLHPKAVIPNYSKPGDAGMDLVITSIIKENTLDVSYGFGIAVEIPEGHVGLLFPRSSVSKTSLVLANHVGVVDSGYRGEIRFRFKDNSSKTDVATSSSVTLLTQTVTINPGNYNYNDLMNNLVLYFYLTYI